MKGEQINKQQYSLLDPISTIDNASTYITVIGLAVTLLILLLMFMQKKRLVKKPTDFAKEKKKLFIRCCVLMPLLLLTALLPKIVTSIAGYGFTSYKMIGVWLPYSFLIAFAVLSAMILMMLISSITRYFIVKDKK